MAKKKNKKFMRVDTFFISIIFLLCVFIPSSIVFSHATLSKSNIEVEKIKSIVEKQENSNQSLSMQVDELGSLSNIQDVAKEYGLSYNNDNIIVIK